MANTVRVENLTAADQELAPGSGFIPAHGSRDYPADEYKEQHEKYAKARLEADPPILKIGEASGETTGEAAPQPDKSPAQKQTEQNAEDAKKAEEERRRLEQHPGEEGKRRR